LNITDHAEGIVVTVRVQPGAKRSAIIGEHAGGLKIAVAAPPVEGKANDALIAFLRELLQLKRSQVEILRGEKSRQKQVLLRGVGRKDIEALLNSGS
jgi:uncharacterized protein (TIGR00251 family)